MPSVICTMKDKTLKLAETCFIPLLFGAYSWAKPPPHTFFLSSVWKAQRNIFSGMSNGLSLQLLSYFPQTWSWSWASCCRSSRMWWRSWSPRLRAAAAHTGTSCRRPKAARGSGTTAAWRTPTAVSGDGVGGVCGWFGVQGSQCCGWVRLGGFLAPPYQRQHLQLDTVNFPGIRAHKGAHPRAVCSWQYRLRAQEWTAITDNPSSVIEVVFFLLLQPLCVCLQLWDERRNACFPAPPRHHYWKYFGPPP